ncbi:hypothetical protein OPV22_010099 [Ensete ventricosum]|uniref:Bifunctional inhibitor/plant lipid transfer protein/seed storage helical domain-containing protein n=1 Tax=Ensete ventricosum TaxID=4639 RepID=A0AAV8RKL6_ENSVE|nr:hypothetical protein OPV22_010099 [Ensete ventricosum]RWW66164.1 hypothetical protein BHE74_00026492 [Ensete ventricosum]RZS26501.1 hypothetical protein BHM03_00059864 [Ensete ventricosum]
MASKASASFGLFFALNLLFFALTSACGTTCPTPTPKPSHGKCPIDTLKLAACANVLNGLITVGIGKFPKQPCECCTLIDGILDLEAAVCLCTALKANILGINLNVPIDLSLLLNYCGKNVPKEFQCP